jgi:hypothetical protein
MAMMAAETLGIPVERVKPIVADTASIGFTHVTGGSRVTFATGMATVQATEKVIEQLKQRAAMIWDISPEAVDWRDGCAYPAGANAGSFDPLPLADIAIKAARTARADRRRGVGQRSGRDPPSRRMFAMSRSIRDRACKGPAPHGGAGCRTGHPSELQVEGQIQGGVAQDRLGAQRGIHLRQAGPPDNPGSSIIACRSRPTCRMIDAVIVEVPTRGTPSAFAASARCRSCRRWRRSPTRSMPRSECGCAICRCSAQDLRRDRRRRA